MMDSVTLDSAISSALPLKGIHREKYFRDIDKAFIPQDMINLTFALV